MSESTNNLINIPDLPPSVDNAVQNLTDKPTRSIGTSLADLWDLVFGPISYLSEKSRIKYAHNLELFRKRLESSIEQIPPEKVAEPSVQTTAQALENAKYCVGEDDLREMFVSLISNSMNSDFSEQVHPSYSEIIKQMSGLDAKIIRLFKYQKAFPVCQYCLNLSGNAYSNTPLPEHIFLECPDADIMLSSQALSSLSRFGLVSISYISTVTDPNAYDKFTQHPFYEDIKTNFPFEVTIKKGAVIITPLGRSFVEVCIPN